MKRNLWLRNLDHLPIVIDGVYLKYNFTAEEIAAARTKLAQRGLRFDNQTGITRDNEDILAQFRRWIAGTPEQMAEPSKWCPHLTNEDVLKWEFRSFILRDVCRARAKLSREGSK